MADFGSGQGPTSSVLHPIVTGRAPASRLKRARPLASLHSPNPARRRSLQRRRPHPGAGVHTSGAFMTAKQAIGAAARDIGAAATEAVASRTGLQPSPGGPSGPRVCVDKACVQLLEAFEVDAPSAPATLVVLLLHAGPVRTLRLRTGGQAELCSLLVADQTRSWVDVTLWRSKSAWAQHLQPGCVLLLRNVWASTYQGSVRFNTRWTSSMDVLYHPGTVAAARPPPLGRAAGQRAGSGGAGCARMDAWLGARCEELRRFGEQKHAMVISLSQHLYASGDATHLRSQRDPAASAQHMPGSAGHGFVGVLLARRVERGNGELSFATDTARVTLLMKSTEMRAWQSAAVVGCLCTVSNAVLLHRDPPVFGMREDTRIESRDWVDDGHASLVMESQSQPTASEALLKAIASRSLRAILRGRSTSHHRVEAFKSSCRIARLCFLVPQLAQGKAEGKAEEAEEKEVGAIRARLEVPVGRAADGWGVARGRSFARRTVFQGCRSCGRVLVEDQNRVLLCRACPLPVGSGERAVSWFYQPMQATLVEGGATLDARVSSALISTFCGVDAQNAVRQAPQLLRLLSSWCDPACKVTVVLSDDVVRDDNGVDVERSFRVEDVML